MEKWLNPDLRQEEHMMGLKARKCSKNDEYMPKRLPLAVSSTDSVRYNTSIKVNSDGNGV